MNDLEFAEKAQSFLPEEILNEMSDMVHSISLSATCEQHMLLSYVLDYGVNILASQIGADEVKTKLWPKLQEMARAVNAEHIRSLGDLRAKYPEEFATAEAEASKSGDEYEHKLALLREMLGQAQG